MSTTPISPAVGRPMTKAKLIPAALRLPPNAEPFTIRRLRNIRPGERIVYYRGSIADEDAAATPQHSELLGRIFGVAKQLELKGRVRLAKVKVAAKADDPTKRASMWEFTATGLSPPPEPEK
jgi:hypothetical protein